MIIAICATAPRSGKDTFAEYLKAELEGMGASVATIAFADKLREECADLFIGHANSNFINWSKLDAHKDEPKVSLCLSFVEWHPGYVEEMLRKNSNIDKFTPLSPRWHLQRYGNDYIKDTLGLEDYWVGHTALKANRLLCTNDFVIITDARSPNEFEWLYNSGAEIVQVTPHDFPARDYVSEHCHKVEGYDPKQYVTKNVLNVFGRQDFLKAQANAFAMEVTR